MPRPARTQGCPKQPVLPFPTRSNTLTAPIRSVFSDTSPSFPIPWIGFSPASRLASPLVSDRRHLENHEQDRHA
jgi:hypothetical protein